MENIVEKYIDTIQFIFNEVITSFNSSYDYIKKLTDEQEDIEHEIELTDTEDGLNYWTKELRRVRRERRKVKNENELIEEFFKFVDENKSFIDKLGRIKGNSRKVFTTQENRIYKARVRKDLTITCHKPNGNFVLDDAIKELKEGE